ncbi:MAG TPA: glycosyltransferase family 4 protein [Verrucomicrobiae bacterium]|nr:glycosyltransferase family 4 protein [Verrucomicrobiae bacterium]
MKLLVFAHKPPPHHGQSYMVQLLLDALGGDARERPAGKPAPPVECFHVDARYSDAIADIGQAGLRKLARMVWFCTLALWCRLRHGATHLYYVPAFPARAPVWRDWFVLGLCRPFFKALIYHWHTTGLGEWLDEQARPWERWLSRRLFGRPTLSIVLRPYNRRDAEYFESPHVEVVPNGIPDPCPDFDRQVLPRRLARIDARRKMLAGGQLTDAEAVAAGGDPQVYRALFLGVCYSGKGLFDAVEAVALAHRKLKGSAVGIRLAVAGKFWHLNEAAQFDQRLGQPDLRDEAGRPLVDYRGFVGGQEKIQLLTESDCIVFPTYMAESFGLVLLEGMAFGLPLITTHSRNIPEMLPPNSKGIVDPRAPEQIAAALIRLLDAPYDPALREHFLSHYTERHFRERIREALCSIEPGAPDRGPGTWKPA